MPQSESPLTGRVPRIEEGERIGPKGETAQRADIAYPVEVGSADPNPGEHMEPLYPHIKVELVGEDGNAFFIIGRVRKALRRGGDGEEVVAAFTEEATAGDYDNVIRTAMKYVEVL